MSISESKVFIKSQLSKESNTDSKPSDFERDDDDPLTIGSLSLTFLGIILACMTLLLPSISIFIGRPFARGEEIIFNYDFKEDGS